MQRTDHISDEQLNEYLDRETNDRARIDLHLSTCRDCSARLIALQDLFSEIESLPDLELSQEFGKASLWSPASLAPGPNLSAPLPRSLTLTLALQATLAIAAIIVAAPFVMQFLSFSMANISVPSLADIFLPLQSQWTAWLDMLSKLPTPTIPEIPVVNVSNLFVVFTVLGVSLLWLIGNGLLLRNQIR